MCHHGSCQPKADAPSRRTPGASHPASAQLLAFGSPRAYRRHVTADDARTCALCGNPIDSDQAWMTSDDGRLAHSGCVYSDADVAGRDRWMPPD